MEPLLQEDELALAVALCADGVLIVLQEVDHAGVGDTGLFGDVDLRKALRGGIQQLSDLGATVIARHTGTPLRAGRGGGRRRGRCRDVAGGGNLSYDLDLIGV